MVKNKYQILYTQSEPMPTALGWVTGVLAAIIICTTLLIVGFNIPGVGERMSWAALNYLGQ